MQLCAEFCAHANALTLNKFESDLPVEKCSRLIAEQLFAIDLFLFVFFELNRIDKKQPFFEICLLLLF